VQQAIRDALRTHKKQLVRSTYLAETRDARSAESTCTISTITARETG